jgi:hypothetical protein
MALPSRHLGMRSVQVVTCHVSFTCKRLFTLVPVRTKLTLIFLPEFRHVHTTVPVLLIICDEGILL